MMLALAVSGLSADGPARWPTSAAKQLFGFSILYLTLLFAVLLAEHSLALAERMADGDRATAAAATDAQPRVQQRSRRLRNIALAVVIGVLVVLFYVMTIAKMGGRFYRSSDLRPI